MGRPIPTRVYLPSNVRAARKSAKLSQRKLAMLIGMGKNSAAYISRVEKGKLVPRLKILIAIAQATRTPLELLIHGMLGV